MAQFSAPLPLESPPGRPDVAADTWTVRIFTARRLRLYAAAFLVLALVVAGGQLFKLFQEAPVDAVDPPTGDLAPRLAAARLIASGQGPSLYDLDQQHSALQAVFANHYPSYVEPYLSPPFVGLIYLPLIGLPYNLAATIWVGVTVGLVFAALWLLRPFIPLRWSALFLASSWPTVELAVDSQDSAIALLVLAAGLRLLVARRDGWAGAVLALGLFKPQLFLLLPVLLLCQRRYRAVGGYAAVAVALALVSLGMVGVGGLVDWYGLARSPLISNAVVKMSWHQLSMAAFVRGFLGDYPNAVLGVMIVVALAVLVPFVRYARRMSPDENYFLLLYALAIVGGVLITPYAFVYDGIILVIPAALAVRVMPNSTTVRWSLVAAFVLLWTTLPRLMIFGSSGSPNSALTLSLAPLALAVLAIAMTRQIRLFSIDRVR